jgi:urease subunit gamma/beta
VRFEPGISKDVTLVSFGGDQHLSGLNNLTNGVATDPAVRDAAIAAAKARGFKGA